MRESSPKQLNSKMVFFLRIATLLSVMVAAIVLFFGVRGVIKAQASVGWPTVAGEIKTSSVESHHSKSGSDSSTTYHAEVLYEYSISGAKFNGDRVAYGDYGSSNPSHARSIVNRYPKGKTVIVYHSPTNYEESLLEPGLKVQTWLMPGIGLFFFITGIVMVIFLPKLMEKMYRVIE